MPAGADFVASVSGQTTAVGTLRTDFSFVGTYTVPTAANVGFYFGGALVVGGVSVGDSSQYGPQTKAANKAQGVLASGFAPAVYGREVVWNYVANAGAAINFPFTASYSIAVPHTSFYFGGQIVVPGVSAGDTSVFGAETKVKAPLLILCQNFGIAPGVVGRPRTSGRADTNFAFTASYTLPPAANVPFYFGGQIVANILGADSNQYGPLTKVSNKSLSLTPVGIYQGVVSRARAYIRSANGAQVDFGFVDTYSAPTATTTNFVFTRPEFEAGVSANASATADLQIGNRLSASAYASASAFAFELISQPRVENAGGIYSAAFGNLFASTNPQFVIAGDVNQHAVGAPTVSLRIRYVFPESIAYKFTYDAFGNAAYVSDAIRKLVPPGYDSSLFGAHGVRRNETIVDVEGKGIKAPTQISFPSVTLYRRYVFYVGSIPPPDITSPTAYNLNQYVTQYYNIVFPPIQDKYGAPSIVNRNRTVFPDGWNSLKLAWFPASLDLTPTRSPAPVGFISEAIGSGAKVELKKRVVVAEGIPPLYFPQFSQVYNWRKIVYPVAISAPYPPIPIVSTNTQWVYSWWSNADTAFGNSFTAYRIRYITGLAGLAPPDVPQPRVGNYTQYVVPVGRDMSDVPGIEFALAFFNAARPYSIYSFASGTPAVANRNRQVYPQSAFYFESPQVGRLNYVFNRKRFVYPSSFVAAGHSALTVIDYKTKLIYVTGNIAPPKISELHEVRDPAPSLPRAQTVNLDSRGIPSKATVSSPSVQGSPLPNGWASLIFGSPSVRAQGARPYWDFPDSDFQWGTPSVNSTQTISVESFAQYGVGYPRATPWVIWCTGDVPPNLIAGYSAYGAGNGFQQVDSYSKFGTPSASTPTYPKIQAYGIAVIEDAVGLNTSVTNRRRWLYLTGIKPPRFGYPELPDSKLVLVNSIDPPQSDTDTVVALAQNASNVVLVPTSVLPPDLSQTETRIENFNRQVLPQGFVATIYMAVDETRPVVYLKPRGPKPTGWVNTSWGVPLVSYRIRTVYPSGSDSFTSEYSLGSFNNRLRVRRDYERGYPTGIPPGNVGSSSSVKNNVQVVTAYMIAPPRCDVGHHLAVSNIS